MECERAGTLRTYLDGEIDPVTARRVSKHLHVCSTCRDRLEQVQAVTRSVGAQLELLATPFEASTEAQSARAWGAIQTRLARSDPTPQPAAASSSKVGRFERMRTMLVQALSLRQRAALAAAFIAALLVGMTFVPGGRALAGDFLNLFRVQRFKVVTVDPRQSGAALQHLEHLGTISPQQPHATAPADVTIEEAAAQVGSAILVPTKLPGGIPESPRIQVVPASEMSFTVDRQKAEDYLRSIGAKNASVPAQLDGARLTLNVPAAVMLTYMDESSKSGLAVGQVASPTAKVDGAASLADMREFLLNIPDLPEDTVAQLRAIDDWTTTLPLPLPRDKAVWRETTLNGAQALVFSDPAINVSGLIWLRDGIIHGVGGTFSEQQILEVATSLR